MEQKINVSGYRWVILMAIVPMIISTEMMWLSLAPISSLSAKFYGVSTMSVDMLAVSYMIMFILFSIPASWIVDKFGYRYSLIIGAVLTAIFGIVRGIFADNFTVVLIAQFMIAIGQPFLLNISTKVPANWFPINERSTAAGILTMAQYVGFTVPMLLSPGLAESQGIPGVMKVYATIAVISAVVSIVFTREKPRVAPPGPMAQRDDLSKEAVVKLVKNKPYMTVLLICFISMGIFNSVLTLLETILLPLGISSAQSGIIGAVFVISGVVGAIILPVLSDKMGSRIPFFVGSIIILIPVYIGFTFLHNFYLLAVMAILAGFCIMGVAPILFQHGSEVAYPVQEGTSLGMILLMGQISGVLIVYIFDVLKNLSGAVVLPMLLIVAATILELPIVLKIKESDFNLKRKCEIRK
ncbi:MAG: MFS transporter [Lachnospiraceae bacterium]|nr:MFS transporter [Lachnospiraceae bacterium]